MTEQHGTRARPPFAICQQRRPQRAAWPLLVISGSSGVSHSNKHGLHAICCSVRLWLRIRMYCMLQRGYRMPC